jgi:hypothetical protein
VLLRQLRDAAPAPIFGDLAQDALHASRVAVAGAAESIRARAPLDGALFAVRHLLLLKELAGGLELAQRAEDADAPGVSGGVVSDTLASVLTRTSALIPSALFASLGMPRADENIGDAKLVRPPSRASSHTLTATRRASTRTSRPRAKRSSPSSPTPPPRRCAPGPRARACT